MEKNDTSTSLFSDEDSVDINPDTNISDFEDSKDESYQTYTGKVYFNYACRDKNNLKSFKNFIDKRKTYLESLSGIEDWMSGRSDSPSDDTIRYSKYYLEVFKNWIHANERVPIPKVIMSPIPTGGISIELRPNQKSGLFVTIYNDEEVEVDVMINEEYHTVDLDKFKADSYLLEAYEIITSE